MKKYILYGAGENGVNLCGKLGTENVEYFCDNSPGKHGKMVCNKKVISFDELLKLNLDNYILCLTPETYGKIGIRALLHKNKITDYIEYNEYEDILEYPKAMISKHGKKDEKLKSFVDESSKLDMFSQWREFRKITEKLFECEEWKNKPYIYQTLPEESQYYGNIDVLFDYASLDKKDMFLFPSICHVSTCPYLPTDYKYNSSVIYSGQYYKDSINRCYDWIPAYTVGPYINYSPSLYSADETRRIKSVFGRTITVFMAHSVEKVERNYNEKKFVDTVLAKYKNSFDTIILCVYWSDITHEVCEYAESLGLKVITTGYRFDNKFLMKQRSLFEITDAIVCQEPSTAVNYSLFFNKPVGIIGNLADENIEISDDYLKSIYLTPDIEANEYFYKFYKVFDEELTITKEKLALINPFIGFDQIKSREYIQYIMKINKSIWKIADNKISNFKGAVNETLKYFKSQNMCDEERILLDALGRK